MTDQPLSSLLCANCGVINAHDSQTCANCGAPLTANMRIDPSLNDLNGSRTVNIRRPRCNACGHVNPPSWRECEKCGAALETTEIFDAPVTAARRALTDEQPAAALSSDEVRAVKTAGVARFEDDMILRIEVESLPTPLLVYPAEETVIGRRDPVSVGAPDVDLTSYAGYRMGVSRHHAVLRLVDNVLTLHDLGSSNGTYVNGKKLEPNQPQVLRDGDEIGLGKLVMHIYFQSAKRATREF